MRIYGNRLLKTLPGQHTRPTSSRVREALFNIWQGQLQKARWLDLCAGNGTIGAEALCRGIDFLVGIEKNRRACQIIQENWQKVATTDQQFKVIPGDINNKLKDLKGQQFDFISFDPPYDSDLYEPVLTAISQLELLAKDGEMAVEHDSTPWDQQAFSNLIMTRQKQYGSTYLSFWKVSK